MERGEDYRCGKRLEWESLEQQRSHAGPYQFSHCLTAFGSTGASCCSSVCEGAATSSTTTAVLLAACATASEEPTISNSTSALLIFIARAGLVSITIVHSDERTG
jgi:hypothetical protein